MPAADEVDAGRKRRAHTKSRRGCGNCKLRRVKCDEQQPSCDRCKAYGVACDYSGTAANELRYSGEAAFVVEPSVPNTHVQVVKQSLQPPQLPPTPPAEIILGMLNYPLALHETNEVYRVTEKDLDRLRRFQERTVLTIGTAQTVYTYRETMLTLACHHDYLMHVVFTIVLMHDRYLSDKPWQPPTTEETFHHYHGTAMFNNMLSSPIPHVEKDAMWGAAALLGAITIAAVEATTPEDSWPLKPESPNDLDWLRMSDGKREVWRLADPLREDSIWHAVMRYDYDKDPTPKACRPELEVLMPQLLRLYNYDASSEGTDNPYHTATSIIVRLLPMQCTHSTILYFLSFIGHMTTEYKELLHQKDDRALLLLALWWATMLDYPAWWHQRRAVLECKAICIFLGRRYVHYSDVGRLLDFPKAMCGLAVSPVFMKHHDEARLRET